MAKCIIGDFIRLSDTKQSILIEVSGTETVYPLEAAYAVEFIENGGMSLIGEPIELRLNDFNCGTRILPVLNRRVSAKPTSKPGRQVIDLLESELTKCGVDLSVKFVQDQDPDSALFIDAASAAGTEMSSKTSQTSEVLTKDLTTSSLLDSSLTSQAMTELQQTLEKFISHFLANGSTLMSEIVLDNNSGTITAVALLSAVIRSHGLAVSQSQSTALTLDEIKLSAREFQASLQEMLSLGDDVPLLSKIPPTLPTLTSSTLEDKSLPSSAVSTNEPSLEQLLGSSMTRSTTSVETSVTAVTPATNLPITSAVDTESVITPANTTASSNQSSSVAKVSAASAATTLPKPTTVSSKPSTTSSRPRRSLF
jgi:hypothetical protein